MDSRERTFLALEHTCGDRLPVDFWASDGMIRLIEKTTGLSYEAFLDRHDVDLRYIDGPVYKGPVLTDGRDIWGVPRTTVTVKTGGGQEVYKEVSESPLAGAETAEDIERYAHWPSPDWYDYSTVEAQCETIRRKGRVVVFMGDRLNRVSQLKPAMYLRGIENIFEDLVVNAEVASALFGRIKRFYLEYLDRILTAARGKIDIVLTGDDFGSQNGLLMAPGMWRSFLMPGFKEYLDLIRSHRCKSMHHTCGSVRELLPDFIGCGLDVLQAIQPEARHMELRGLKAEFGRRIGFQGGISIQKTMPFGTPADIRSAVREISGIIGRDGGYIFCTSHNIQTDTPMENVLALLDAYREYGRR